MYLNGTLYQYKNSRSVLLYRGEVKRITYVGVILMSELLRVEGLHIAVEGKEILKASI